MASITGKEIDWIVWDEISDSELFKDLYEGKWVAPHEPMPVFKMPDRLAPKIEKGPHKLTMMHPHKSGKTEMMRRYEEMVTSVKTLSDSLEEFGPAAYTASTSSVASDAASDHMLDAMAAAFGNHITKEAMERYMKEVMAVCEPEFEPEPNRGDLWGTW